MSKKVAITGVAGFIGSNLAERLLADGYEVVGIDNLEFGLKEQIPAAVDFHQADIRDKNLSDHLKDVSAVFHLAAKNCISDCQKDPVQTADINVVGTVNVLEACRLAGVKKVIVAESSAIYEGTEVFPTPEQGQESPTSFYADSKLATHYFSESYAKHYSLEVTMLRYFNIYGPRQDFRRTDRPIMTEFIIQLLTGVKPVLYGEGLRSKDYIYVDDINDFHLLLLKDSRGAGKVFNLGSGQVVTFKEVLDRIQLLLGTQVIPELKPALTGGVMKTQADISQAKSLGWEPKTSLDDGLKQSIEYIKTEVLPKL